MAVLAAAVAVVLASAVVAEDRFRRSCSDGKPIFPFEFLSFQILHDYYYENYIIRLHPLIDQRRFFDLPAFFVCLLPSFS